VKVPEIAAAVDGHLLSEPQRVWVRQAAQLIAYLEGEVEKLHAIGRDGAGSAATWESPAVVCVGRSVSWEPSARRQTEAVGD